MADTEKMYGDLSESKLDEITEKIEMRWKESLFGILTILNGLSPEERKSFLNVVSQSLGREVMIPQDIDAIIKFSLDYLVSRGVDVSKRPGLHILNPNSTDQGLYERATSIAENYKRGR